MVKIFKINKNLNFFILENKNSTKKNGKRIKIDLRELLSEEESLITNNNKFKLNYEFNKQKNLSQNTSKYVKNNIEYKQ